MSSECQYVCPHVLLNYRLLKYIANLCMNRLKTNGCYEKANLYFLDHYLHPYLSVGKLIGTGHDGVINVRD